MQKNIFKWIGICVGLGLMVILIFGSDLINLYQEVKEIQSISSEFPSVLMIQVEIKGAVCRPGVYEVYEGSTLNDLLRLAIASDDADISELNLAQKVKEGESYTIPYAKVESSLGVSLVIPDVEESSSSSVSKININLATLIELQTLPGIGPAKAQKIIDYIATGKKIKSYEELAKIVGGLKDSDLESIKEQTILE